MYVFVIYAGGLLWDGTCIVGCESSAAANVEEVAYDAADANAVETCADAIAMLQRLTYSVDGRGKGWSWVEAGRMATNDLELGHCGAELTLAFHGLAALSLQASVSRGRDTVWLAAESKTALCCLFDLRLAIRGSTSLPVGFGRGPAISTEPKIQKV